MGEIVPHRDYRDKVARLMAVMRKHEQLKMTEAHHVCPGVYARVLHMPKGATIVSKIHKTEHFVVCVKGKALVVYPDRKELVSAPKLMVTKPGTQRALHILEDSTWIGFYPTIETDVEKIEDNIIAKNWEDPQLLEYFSSQGLLTHSKE